MEKQRDPIMQLMKKTIEDKSVGSLSKRLLAIRVRKLVESIDGHREYAYPEEACHIDASTYHYRR